MPSLSRRRDTDSRSGRLESEMRMQELQATKPKPGQAAPKRYMCSSCHRMFEERSRHCPRCDTRTMGEIRQLGNSTEDRARYRAQSIKRLQAKSRS